MRDMGILGAEKGASKKRGTLQTELVFEGEAGLDGRGGVVGGDGVEQRQGEHALIERAKRDAEAFGDLYRRYVARIYSYQYRHTGNAVEAEDLTSRTFYRALRSLHSYRDTGGSFQAWLFRIAHNLLVNWYRDEGRRRVVSLEVAPGDVHTPHGGRLRDEPHETVIHSERQAWLSQLLNTLPEERKTLLILKFVEKMSNEEIANVLGRTEGAIKSLYHRTLSGLRELIEQGEFADELL
ncbi:MAG TPA: sigma-70 family RNA polymerase sigma factor [Anaerolineae bacterium]|nr:sigma-70 family RNA polymerase sigma factor [Anaerolineae bacterium]